MEIQKSIKLNFIMNACLTMSSFIFQLITFPYVSRILLPAGTGRVSFAASLTAYFTMFAQLGIPTYGIRICAKVREDREKLTKTAQELLIINLGVGVISYIVLFLLIITVPRFREEWLLYTVMSSSVILNSIGMEWIYKALEQYTYIAVRSIIAKVVALAVMILLVHTETDYVIYGGITVLASSASYLFNFIHVHKFISLKPIGKYDFRKHLKPIGTFFAMACATTIYTNLDNVMLGFMSNEISVGYYDAAIKIRKVLLSVVTSLGAVILPRASYYVEHKLWDEFYRITAKAFSFVLVVAMPMTVFFMLFAKESIYFLSGESYAGSILPMQVIMPTLLLVGITNVLGLQVLVPLGREDVVLKAEVFGAVIDVVINLILIPQYAALGAAIGTLAAEFTVLVVQLKDLPVRTRKVFYSIHYSKLIIALIFGCIMSFWVKHLEIRTFSALLIASSLFFGSYGLILFFTKEKFTLDIINQISEKIKNKWEK